MSLTRFSLSLPQFHNREWLPECEKRFKSNVMSDGPWLFAAFAHEYITLAACIPDVESQVSCGLSYLQRKQLEK